MSDTPNTPETSVNEVTETPTTEITEAPVAEETQATKGKSRDVRGDRGGRRPRRGDRRGAIREEQKEFHEEILSIDRVTRVTAGGRQLRFRVSLVIGDGKGRVGLGIGKSGEVQGAIEKALRDARKNLVTFPIVNGTIAHDVTVNFKSSAIFLHPAHPGTGIIAGGTARKVFAVSGIKDIIAKQHGSPNRITNTRVTLKALKALKPLDQIRSFSKTKTGSDEATEVAPTPAPKKTVAKKATASKAPKKTTKKETTPKKKTA